MSQATQRPILLSVGILGTAGLATLYLLGLVLIWLVGTGALTIAAVEELRDEEVIGALIGGGVLTCLIGFFVLFNVFQLVVCAGAWKLGRGWLVTLTVLAALGLAIELTSYAGSSLWCCLPVPLVIHLLTVVGALQALTKGGSSAPPPTVPTAAT